MTRIPTPLLTVDQMQVSFPHGEFEDAVGQVIGSGFVDGDGDDAALEATAVLLDSDSASVNDLDTFLADADFVTGEFEGSNVSPVAAELNQVISDGDGILNDLGGTITPGGS